MSSEVNKEKEPKLPSLNLGALFMPALWGPAHGFWITILFYPLWVFVDSSIMSAVTQGGFAIILAIICTAGTIGFTIFFAFTSTKPAYERVKDRYSLAQYLKREKIWAIVCALVTVVMLVLATIYNLWQLGVL